MPGMKASSGARRLEWEITRDDLGLEIASASLEQMGCALESHMDAHLPAPLLGCDFTFLISTWQWHDQHAVVVLVHNHRLIGSRVHGDRKLL